MIVSDIEAGRKELLGHGVEVSEVFHGGNNVYAGRRALLVWADQGQRPGSEHRSYRSFASFVIRTATAG